MVTRPDWVLYGAYGFTGELIAREAVRRGYRPLLAGRDGKRLAPLALELGCRWVAVDLDDETGLRDLLTPVPLVVHAAGPFMITADPMRRACLATGTSYIDITGELPVLIDTYSNHQAALDHGICLISGCGFDVVPSDAVAAYLKQRLPSIRELLLVVDSNTTPSGGTVGSAIAMADLGGAVRRDWQIVKRPLGADLETIDLPWGRRGIIPMPLGDLESAFWSTGAASITTAMALPPGMLWLLRLLAPLLRAAARSARLRELAGRAARRFFKGPDSSQRESVSARVWGEGIDSSGQRVEAWVQVIEPYRFTAEAIVHAVERTLAEKPIGALTPSQAFGVDFVMEILGSVRASGVPMVDSH